MPTRADSIRIRILRYAGCEHPGSRRGCTDGELTWIPATPAAITSCATSPRETALQWPGRTGLGTAAVPIPRGDPRTAQPQGYTPGLPCGALGPRVGSIHRRQFGRSRQRHPALHPRSPIVPRNREMPRRTRLFLPPQARAKTPPDYFCRTLWLQLRVSSLFFHTGQLRLRGRVGMWWQRRKPSPKSRRGATHEIFRLFSTIPALLSNAL